MPQVSQKPSTVSVPTKPPMPTKPVQRPVSTPKPAPVAPTTASVSPVPATPPPSGGLGLAHVKRVWSQMTAAVQAQKTYLGTYLLEGAPVAVNGQTLTVAFPDEYLYHKECLEETAAIKLVSDVFSGILGQSVQLSFVLMNAISQDKSAQLQQALDAFDGEVVNEWHNE
ncbi:MAG: hypothetical protein V2A70_06355 [Candidatus Omnitrophota bacterium]